MYTRRYTAAGGLSTEQAHELALLSHETGRQTGLLIDRRGRVSMVLVGTAQGIYIPELPRARHGRDRLRGLRLLHTHLPAGSAACGVADKAEEGLSQEDLMDMVFLRLDAMTVLTMDAAGQPVSVYDAHLLPPNPQQQGYALHGPFPFHAVPIDYAARVQALEDELARSTTQQTQQASATATDSDNNAILVSVGMEPKAQQQARLSELAELAATAGVHVAGTMIQRVRKLHPKTILGKGKLTTLEVQALQSNAGIIIFNSELTPAQIRTLADTTERKILDRTQLILDIFARHATTRSGKLQVEMAQLSYTLPRLTGTGVALSRLMGGIGGRGPGETKLETDRRRIRERITRIKKELGELRKRRRATRRRRAKAGLPIVALAGYTNAGKSTLLNTLTRSEVLAEDKLFATLDPTSRRLRIPRERAIVLTDTVGFIRHLPAELREAFRATLEELEEADLLLHIAEASHPEVDSHIQTVEALLEEMDLHTIPRLLVLNKTDKITSSERTLLCNAYPQACCITATKRATLTPLIDAVLEALPAGSK